MARKIDDFFNAYPGLDLIQNPKKCRRTKWFQSDNVNSYDKDDINSHDNQDNEDGNGLKITEHQMTLLDHYKKDMYNHINKLSIPIKTFQRSDHLTMLLEMGYYYYSHSHPELSKRKQLETTPTDGDSSSKDNESSHLLINETTYESESENKSGSGSESGSESVVKQIVTDLINKIDIHSEDVIIRTCHNNPDYS